MTRFSREESLTWERYGATRPKRRWDRVSWWYSLVLVVPVLGLLFSLAWSSEDDTPGVSGVVKDAYTGDPVSNAVVSTANATATTNGDGRFTVPDLAATSLNVMSPDYEATQVPLASVDDKVEIKLRPTSVKGVVKNKRSDKPVAGVTVVATGPHGETVTATTNEKGEYLLRDIPAGAVVSVVYEGSTLASQPVEQDVDIDFKIRPDALTGIVTDESGRPVSGAKIAVGAATATTGSDGAYRLSGIPESGTVTIRKAGYADISAEIPESLKLNAALKGAQVHAVYANAQTVANDQLWAQMIELADTTEINAIVLDLKDSTGHVFYDSRVSTAAEVGAVMPAYDLTTRLQQLNEHNIYAIGRIVVFEDPLLAEARPDLAITDVTTGELWRTWDGRSWVNPHHRDVWNYNVNLAVEAAEAGFDEIQLDGVRFPSDGILDSAGYGEAWDSEPKVDAITGFLTQMRDAIAATNAYLAINIDGLTLWTEDDGNIGEDFATIAPLVDVISPKVYPSHFYPGLLGFDIPNNHPYDVVLQTLQAGNARVPEAAGKLRPWLQDFSYGEGIEYGPAEVTAQIQAAKDIGVNGWMVWNPSSTYSGAAFAAE